MFVKKGEKVAVTVDGVTDQKDVSPDTDTIYIKPKMNFGDHQQLNDAMIDLEAGSSNADVALGALNRALMVINIVGWAGPSFAGVPLSEGAIDSLDMDESLVGVVLAEVTRRYMAQVVKDPKGPAATAASTTGDST